MAYKIVKSNGSTITIADNALDSTYGVQLVGKNRTSYGTPLNQNFFRLMENFANSSAPSNPQTGQIWWDTNGFLKIWTGSVWKSLSGALNSQPNVPVTGDMWYDTDANQLKVYDGSTWVTIGPATRAGLAEFGFIPKQIQSGAVTYNVIYLYNDGELLAIVTDKPISSPTENGSPLSGFTSGLKPGINYKTNYTEDNLGTHSGNVTVPTGGYITTPVIQNGTSNIRILTSANLAFTSGGNANILVITGTGANVTGYLNVTGNANVNNIIATNANVVALTATGNANVGNIGSVHSIHTGNGSFGNINSVSGILSVTGNANVGNIGATNSVFTGNINANNSTVTTNLTAGNASITANITAGNITTTSNISTVNLTVSGKTNLGSNVNLTITGGAAGTYLKSVSDGVLMWDTPPSGGGAGGTVNNGTASQVTFYSTTGNAVSGSANLTWNGANLLVVTGTANVSNINASGSAAVTGNGSFGNINSVSGIVSVTGNISTGGNLSVTGNATAGNLLSGALISPVSTTLVATSGNSNVRIFANANVSIASAGTLMLTVTSTGANIAGTLNSTGNANVGNIGATNGVFSANLTAGNINSVSGILSITGNANVGNIGATNANLTALTVTGNSYVGKIGAVSGVAYTLPSADGTSGQVMATYGNTVTYWTTASGGGGGSGIVNSALINQIAYYAAGGTTVSGSTNLTWNGTNLFTVTGNANVTNLNASSNAVITANLTAGNINSVSGILSVTGNANVGNIGATNANLTALTATGNANVGNIGATNANITALTATGNANVGNIGATNANLTALTATANIYSDKIGRVSGTAYTLPSTDGSSGQVLVTDGSGSLSWTNNGAGATPTSLVNGTSNVVVALNGNVTVSSAGSANVVVVTSSGANIAGTLNVTGNANVGNIGSLHSIHTGNGSFGNINSVSGILSVTGNANVGNIGATNANITALTATGNANVGNIGATNANLTALTVTGNANVGNIGATNANITALTATGNANVGNIGATAGVFTGVVSGTSASYFATSSGNVGVGTSSPNVKLHVSTTNSGTPDATSGSTATTGVTSRFNSGSVNFDLGTYSNGAGFLQSRSNSNNAVFYDLILNPTGGNIGVGNALPANTLSVNGTVYSSGNANVGNIGATNAVFTGLTASGTVRFNNINYSPTVVSTNSSVTAGNTYIVGANSITLTLPASATAGDKISFVPRPGITTYTIARNGLNVMAQAQDISVDILKPFGIIYDNATNGWLMTNA